VHPILVEGLNVVLGRVGRDAVDDGRVTAEDIPEEGDMFLGQLREARVALD
jgi:hypothetical protein